MARYKHIDTHPRLLAVDLAQQLLGGTFEHALHQLFEHEIDLSHFDACFRNDETGAPGYPPALLLKVVLFAYAQGIAGSRRIARACEEHVTFIALCGATTPHFTTIATFVSSLHDDIARVFAAVLAAGDRQGLIGREMFAIDGVKLPSNASKRRSGTRADFERQASEAGSSRPGDGGAPPGHGHAAGGARRRREGGGAKGRKVNRPRRGRVRPSAGLEGACRRSNGCRACPHRVG